MRSAAETPRAHWLIDEHTRVIALAWQWSANCCWHLKSTHGRPGCCAGAETHHQDLESAWVEARAASFCDKPDVGGFSEYVPQPNDGAVHWTRLADDSEYLRPVSRPTGESLLTEALQLGHTYSKKLEASRQRDAQFHRENAQFKAYFQRGQDTSWPLAGTA